MFILKVNKTRLTVLQRESITSGSVNVYPVRFEFSEDWDGLTRTAVFRAGTESRAVLLSGGSEAVIPWEVLETPNLQLFCGVYGTRDGDTVLPTIWADMGAIWRGTEPSGEEAQPPTPDIWEQKLDAKADGLDYDGLNLSLTSGDKTLSSVQIAGGEGGGPGPAGPEGPRGEPGKGVPEGGTQGQLLAKLTGTDYETGWVENTADQVKFNPGGTEIRSTNVQGAITELFTSVSDGKRLIADAITDKGGSADASAGFAELAEAIGGIETDRLPDGVYKIDLSVGSEGGGTVSGGGCASAGMTCNAKAVPNEEDGYVFENWTEGGEIVNSNPEYSFPVEGGRSLTANFYIPQYAAGVDWFETGYTTEKALYGITRGGGKFAAVGDGGAILTSADGISWTAGVSGTTNILRGIAYGGGIYAAAGNGGTILTSADGISWTARSSGVTTALRYIAHGGDKFVAVGENGTILTSSDGTNWTRITVSGVTVALRGVTYNNDKFVIVGNDGTILTSPDGSSWTPRSSEATKHLIGVTYGGGKFAAVGGSGTILTSADGETWETRASGITVDLQGVAYGSGKFTAVGNGGNILYSADGGTWVKAASPAAAQIYGAAYGDSKFIAVPSAANSPILYSSNHN